MVHLPRGLGARTTLVLAFIDGYWALGPLRGHLMSDVASASAGARVVAATCCDDKHSFFNVLDNDEATFWSTTGMYPHELVVQLANPAKISKVKMMTTNVRRLVLERGDSLDRFEKVFDIELPDRAGRQQTETHQVNFRAGYLKFIFASGWDQFATVHRINVTGDPSA